MQNSIFDHFNDLSFLIPYLSKLEDNINYLQSIRKIIANNKIDVQIQIICKKEAHFINQKDLPFDLATELTVLIDDSLTDLLRRYENIKQYKTQL